MNKKKYLDLNKDLSLINHNVNCIFLLIYFIIYIHTSYIYIYMYHYPLIYQCAGTKLPTW